MPESWPKLNLGRIDDNPAEIGRWFDTTVQCLEDAKAEAARLRASGHDAGANMLVARTMLEFRQFIDDARILARHLWRAAKR